MNKVLTYYIFFFSFVVSFLVMSFMIVDLQTNTASISRDQILHDRFEKKPHSLEEDCPWIQEHKQEYGDRERKGTRKYRPVNLNTKAPVKII